MLPLDTGHYLNCREMRAGRAASRRGITSMNSPQGLAKVSQCPAGYQAHGLRTGEGALVFRKQAFQHQGPLKKQRSV